MILDVGPEEFTIGLTYTGSYRTRDINSLTFDPMPSFNRILKIFSRTRFKEKEVDVKRRNEAIDRREAAAAAAAVLDSDEEFVSSQLSGLSV